MSTTNPGQDPVNTLAPKEPGAPAHDDHDVSGPPAPEVIARGYEADVYDAKSVLSVPLLVILFFVLAFGTVTVIFRFIAYPKGDPRAHPAATQRNKAPLNERLDRIQRGHEVDQPRLEPLRQRTGGELARAVPRPETAEGNSPELHPEDLRPTKDRYPALFGAGQGKIGLDQSMALTDAALKDLFPAQKKDGKPAGPLPQHASQHAPSASNAGRGFGESEAVSPAGPDLSALAPAPKEKEPKKDQPKKEEPPKKPEPPKKENPK